MVSIIKDIANIIFFCIVSCITILTYLHARKTVFAPIRTETFKMQLKAFEEILSFFQNKNESDFMQSFDFHQILQLNSLKMADAYAEKFFDGEISIDKEKRKSIFNPLVGAVISKEYAEKNFFKPTPNGVNEEALLKQKKTKNPALILANWQKYEHGMVEYTQAYQDQLKELARLSVSPLLPKPLRDFIIEFQTSAHQNLSLVGETITECAKEMPEHFTLASEMKEFSDIWIWNEYNNKRKDFEPLAKKILDYINNYLNIENLLQ